MPPPLISEVIQRDLPNGVKYDLSAPDHVLISLPPTSTWSSGLHWHETHTEYLKVMQGSVKVHLGGVQQILSATALDQPEIRVDRYVWHEWQRAEPDGEEVVVVERTDPADGEKALFFWNLNGVIQNAPRLLDAGHVLSWLPRAMAHAMLGLWIELKLMVIFAKLDNVPVFANLPQSVLRTGNLVPLHWLIATDRLLSRILLLAAATVGRFLGIRPVVAEYTPDEVMAEWTTRRGAGKKLR